MLDEFIVLVRNLMKGKLNFARQLVTDAGIHNSFAAIHFVAEVSE